jgi:hypothetical protein
VPGEVAGICIRDEVDHLVAAMAVLWMDTAQISLGSHESGTTKRALADKVGVTQLIVETPEDWMEGLRMIARPSVGWRDLRGLASGFPSATPQGRTIDSVAIYQNTSGSTNVPRTFGISLERLKEQQRSKGAAISPHGVDRIRRVSAELAEKEAGHSL